MKHLSLCLIGALLLCALGEVHPSPILAAEDAVCVADPAEGPAGTVFRINCSGYDPDTNVYPYLVQPDGAAEAYFYREFGRAKTDHSGRISLDFNTRYGAYATVSLGTWRLVVEQLGPGHTVVHRGVGSWRVTGGTEGVSGASLTVTPATLHKPSRPYNTEPCEPNGYVFICRGEYYLRNSSEAHISGTGFAPGEFVSLWFDYPYSACSNLTSHYSDQERFFNGIFGSDLTGTFQSNIPHFLGLGSRIIGTARADGSGRIGFDMRFYDEDCEGVWHIVGRGNTSGRGGDTYLTLVGNPVSQSAILVASPSTASAMFGRITFSGSGFAANEPVTCWLTSPEGQVTRVPEQPFFVGTMVTFFTIFSIKDVPTQADASGHLSFELVTGSYYERYDYKVTDLFSGRSGRASGESFGAAASEGALGQWAMTCRGGHSGNTGIANFMLTGGVVDP